MFPVLVPIRGNSPESHSVLLMCFSDCCLVADDLGYSAQASNCGSDNKENEDLVTKYKRFVIDPV